MTEAACKLLVANTWERTSEVQMIQPSKVGTTTLRNQLRKQVTFQSRRDYRTSSGHVRDIKI